MPIFLTFITCLIVVSKAFAGVELEGYSFANQIDGAIPPTDPYPLSTPNILNAVTLSLVVGQSGNAGNNNGPASDSSTTVTAPTFVWGDSVGNVYFSTPRSNVIRKIAGNDNVVSTFAGTGVAGYNGEGAATSVQLNKPHGLFGDSNRLVFCDTLNGLIREVSLATNVLTNLAGSDTEANLRGYAGDGGLALSSKLFSPFSVWIDVKDNKGDVYFTELHKCTIRKIDGSTQIITTIAGVAGQCGFNGYSGPGVSTHLSRPYALFGDGEAGLLLVADFNNNLVRQYDMASGQISTIAGQGEANKNSLLDQGNGGPAVESVILRPTGVWRDSEGNVYIAESFSSVVRKIDASTGLISTAVGVLGIKGPFTKVGSNALYHPRGIWGDESVRFKLYVPDTGNHRIMSYALPTPPPTMSPTFGPGIRTTFAGDGNNAIGDFDVAAASTSIRTPHKLWQDSVGNIYISDLATPRIIKVDVNGIKRNFGLGSGYLYGISGDALNLYAGNVDRLLSYPLSSTSPINGVTIAGGGSTTLTVSQSVSLTNAKFGGTNDWIDVFVDNNGNKYISSMFEGKIYKINSGSNLISCIISGVGSIRSIIGDSNRSLYVATPSAIQRVDLIFNVAFIVMGGFGGPGYTADGETASEGQLVGAVSALTIDSSNNLYFTDQQRVVRKISAIDNKISTLAGDKDSSDLLISQSDPKAGYFSDPRGILWDMNNNLLVSDTGTYYVHKIAFSP